MTILAALLILAAFAALLFMGNYRFHKMNEKIHLHEDHPERNFWDNSRMHEDIFLNQN